MVQKIS